jgi:hypothetical protein
MYGSRSRQSVADDVEVTLDCSLIMRLDVTRHKEYAILRKWTPKVGSDAEILGD